MFPATFHYCDCLLRIEPLYDYSAGGYEDDVDHGVEFTYTGSGGRDLSGNKRTAEQSCDQTLTRENKSVLSS